MSKSIIDRRDLMTGVALLSATAAVAAGSAQAAPAAFAPTPKPLPFDPTGIAGLSEKLLISHHDNNYAGAVKRLGAITAEFASLDPATAPGYRLNGLKREELIAWNSMILHDVYFANLGAGGRPGAALATQIERDFGSDTRWRAEFAGMGKALGGGSGWVVLSWSHRDMRLTNQWAADHSVSAAWATPIVVLDMYEHAYAMDYGARAGAYVDAVMAALTWTHADAAFAKASA